MLCASARARVGGLLDDLGRDVRFGLRLLRKHRAFTAAAVLSLALGIGVNTAVFSVVNAWLFRLLPVPAADRLVVVATRDTSGPTLGGVSIPDLEDYREATAGVFEDIAAYSVGFAGLAADGGRAERVFATWVTDNYFPLLGIEPFLGRFIQEGESGPGSAGGVIVIGHSTWVRRFGGDASIVGQLVRVNGRTHTIIGVGPAAFHGTFAFRMRSCTCRSTPAAPRSLAPIASRHEQIGPFRPSRGWRPKSHCRRPRRPWAS